MLKPGQLRRMDEEELEQKLKELKEELFNLRFQFATGQLDNPMRIKQTRRDIARVCTIMTERKYSIHPAAFEEAAEMEALEVSEETLELEEDKGEIPIELEDVSDEGSEEIEQEDEITGEEKPGREGKLSEDEEE